MQKSLRMAEPFIVGCPACLQNFRNLFCTLFCSPDQATFANVTAVQQAPPARGSALGTAASSNETWGGVGEAVAVAQGVGLRAEDVTAVKEVAFFLSEEFKNATFMSCSNVVFGSANTRAMLFIGNGATTAQVRAPSHDGLPHAFSCEPASALPSAEKTSYTSHGVPSYTVLCRCVRRRSGAQLWQQALFPALTVARAQRLPSRYRTRACSSGHHFASPTAICWG